MKHARTCIIHLICLLAFVCSVQAQEVLLPRAYETSNVGIVYDREIGFPVSLHTNGFFFGFTSGKLKTYYKTSYWGMNVGHIKNPREFKQSRNANTSGLRNSGSSYIYGKQRTLIPLRAYKGWKRYWSGKDRRRGVAVATNVELGFTAGITKAYELQVTGIAGESPGAGQKFINYDTNPDEFLERNTILGAGGLQRGWSNIRVNPGINAKAGVHLDWGAFDEFMRGLEAGIMVDVFASNVNLLVPPADNTPLFVNFYIALQLGKRR